MLEQSEQKLTYRRDGATAEKIFRGETSAGSLQIDGFGSLAAFIGFGLERNPHSLVEFADSRSFDSRHVHEHVIATCVWLDEAIAFLGIIELHGTCLAHASSPGSPASTEA
jgi:hypothetical protein